MKRAVIYARVSTAWQANGNSIEGQLTEVREWAAKNDYKIIREYVDEGESGSSTNRTNFKRMISEAPSLEIEALLCWKHSRLFRSMEDAILHKHLLAKKKIRLISISEPIEDGPIGRLVEHVLMAINEFYSGNLAEDVLRGLCELARQGFLTCNPAYGYKAVEVKNEKGYPKKKAVINEEQAVVVRQIFQWAASGVGLRDITNRLNSRGIPAPRGGRWFESSVFVILHRYEQYGGTLIFNRRAHGGILSPVPHEKAREEWIIVPGALPQIITQELIKKTLHMQQYKKSHWGPRPDQKGWPQKEEDILSLPLCQDVHVKPYRHGWFVGLAQEGQIIAVESIRENKDIPFTDFLLRRGYVVIEKNQGWFFGYIKKREFFAVKFIYPQN